MEINLLELIRINLLSPLVLAFVAGLAATFLRSDLRFPEALYTALSIYILLAIGLKGGVELSKTQFAVFWKPALASLILGAAIPLLAYPVARYIGRLSVADSAALAAHYGSVSVVTFVVATSFLQKLGIPIEGFMTAILALLELPAIFVGLLLAQLGLKSQTQWGLTIRNILTGKGLFLLIAGMIIGFLAGAEGFAKVEPFFVPPFNGVLMLFLLEMGLVTAARLSELKGKTTVFVIFFATLMPLLQAALGLGAAYVSDLTLGGMTILATLAASASYIVATVAVRLALPQANPGIYLTAALGVTFPFNLTVGIPLYFTLAKVLIGAP
jgi:hypothetical protein